MSPNKVIGDKLRLDYTIFDKIKQVARVSIYNILKIFFDKCRTDDY